MELTIYESIMTYYSIVTQHHSRKNNRKNSDMQIDVVQNFRRFSSIRKNFRINLVVTNNMSTHKNNIITLDSRSEHKLIR